MKKILVLIISAMMVLSATACGSGRSLSSALSEAASEASDSESTARETEVTETSEENTVDIGEILDELQEAFFMKAQRGYYCLNEDYGELYIYKDEADYDDGKDYVEYYCVDSDGTIYDSEGNVISLDDFYIRDEVLEALYTSGDNFWDVLEEERENPDADAYILAASGFSEERAWVVISEGGVTHGYLIDTEGNVIYKNDSMDQDGNRTSWEDMTNCTEVVNGVFLMGDTTLIDADGNTVWSVENDGWSEAERIFGSGSVTDISLKAEDSWNGYPTVIFSIDTYEYTGTYYGLLNPDGTWLIEPVMGSEVDIEFEGYNARSYRAGTGTRFYSSLEEGNDIGKYIYKVSGSETYYVNAKTGDTTNQLEDVTDDAAIDQMNSWFMDEAFEEHDGLLYDQDINGFIDAGGATKIDLSQYTLDSCSSSEYTYYPTFYNGYCVLFLKNEGGGHYLTVIDTQGNQLFEPVKNSYYDRYVKLFGCVSSERIYINGEKQYLNLQGQYVGDEYEKISAYSDGLALVQKSCENANGNTIYTYLYIDPDGNDVFDVISHVTGQSSSSSSTSSGSSSSSDDDNETTEAEEKEYTFISNFTIEGKWKSVGDWGYGQAQPGAIVVFDGKNCNLYSPSDTYAFYEDGDHYVLDATGVLSGTVSFKVYIIDEDNIDLVVSGGTTELTRVG